MVVPLFWRIEMEGIVAKIWNIKEGTMGRGAAVQITDSISYITNSEKCDGVIVNDDFMQVGREVSYVINDITVTSLSDLKKRAFYVKVPVPAGKIMYVQDTVSTNATLDKYLSGYEVTGICVSNFDRAVNGRIREGDVIDIYAVDKTTDELTLYAQDVYVAAAYDSSGNELATDEGVAVAFTIWVKEAEVEKVNQAINFGEIQIYRK